MVLPYLHERLGVPSKGQLLQLIGLEGEGLEGRGSDSSAIPEWSCGLTSGK